MIGKQRLVLGISVALSIVGATGCSTVSGLKTTSENDTDRNVVVHHISFAAPKQHKSAQSARSTKFERLLKARQLDAEIEALAVKLGLGKVAVATVAKAKSQKKERVRRQQRIQHQQTTHKKIAKHKPVAILRQVAFIKRPIITQQKIKQARLAPVNLSAFEREVNRLYANKKTATVVQQTSKNSLWARMMTGYRLTADTDRALVQRMLTRHVRNPKNLNRIFNRSGKYLHFILHELNRRGMPTELALLPMVESAYDNRLHSSRGAVGLWQFTPIEGKRFGLKQTADYDARLDVFASTRAALDKLQRLNRVFKGDWGLTLASYKQGQKAVQHAIVSNRQSGQATDYWNLNLSKETLNYISELLAYREILLRPEAYGLTLPTVTNSPQIMQVVINKSINLHQAARTAGMPVATLANLNLNFKQGMTNPHYSNKIVLPRHYASKLHRSIRSQSALIVASYQPKNTSKRYTVRQNIKPSQPIVKYAVKAGDSLYNIALKKGTTVTNIMRLNGMKHTRIRAGVSLKIALKSSRVKRLRLG